MKSIYRFKLVFFLKTKTQHQLGLWPQEHIQNIDEVHCVSHWGQDFRKDYLHLDILKKRFPEVPILGLTATATQKVKDDMAKRLGIKNTVYYF